jgi:colanic acid/amylovoran biosynthesis protein
VKYVITGITGTRNRGVEALLTTTVEQIEARDPEAKFTVFTADPDYDARRLAQGGVVFLDDSLPLFSPSLKGIKRQLKLRVLPTRHAWARLLNALHGSDVVVASGGDMFASDYGPESLGQNLGVLREATKLSRPVVFLGHSIGPFKTDADLAAFREVARHAALITLRESLSYEYVRQHGDLPDSKVVRTADAAFLLRPSANGDTLFRSLAFDVSPPVVACAVSQGMSRYAGMDADRHRRAWIALIEHLTCRLEAQALLVPHVQERSTRNDDLILATEILRHLSPAASARTRVAGGDFTAAEYKALITRCELVVAERMHAAIAGLSSGRATLVVGYSVKSKGILLDMLGPRVEADGILIPAGSFTDSSELCLRVEGVFRARQAVAAQLHRGREAAEQAAARNFDLLQELARHACAKRAATAGA